MGETANAGRREAIERAGFISIGANVALAALKGAAGFFSNSISLTLDAVNSLTDALSGIVTVAGARLAAKKPDKKHPLGHGRAEYISQFIVAAVIVYAGITSLIESVKAVISPGESSYSAPAVAVMVGAVAVKLFLGLFMKRAGRKNNSGTLCASGTDALSDAALTSSVLAAALVKMLTGIKLEAYVGLVISAAIIYSGIEIIRDAVDELLGHRTQADVSLAVRKAVESVDGVIGAYDLLMHDYGPDRFVASIHVEVADTMTAREIDVLTRRIQEKVYAECGVVMAAVGVYAQNTQSAEEARAKERITEAVLNVPEVKQVHGFFIDDTRREIRLDAVIGFEAESRDKTAEQVARLVRTMYPGYEVYVTADADFSD